MLREFIYGITGVYMLSGVARMGAAGWGWIFEDGLYASMVAVDVEQGVCADYGLKREML